MQVGGYCAGVADEHTMARIIVKWLILTIAVMAASYTLSGVYVEDFFSAFFAAAVLGLLNTFFRPILIILTLPINILSLGLFTFIINAILIKMASGVIAGFEVADFWTAILASLIISVVNWILGVILRDGGGGFFSGRRPRGRGYIDLEKKDGDRWE